MPRKQTERLLALMPAWFMLAGSIIVPGHSTGIAASNPAGTLAPEPTAVDEETRKEVSEAYGKMPLSFEANQGQTAPQVKYFSRGNGYNLYLSSNEAVLVLNREASDRAIESQVLRVKLMGANSRPQMMGINELAGKSHYLTGSDSRQWRANVANYAGVRYRDVYPGIDMVYYGHGRQLEYDFIVAPGADANRIQLTMEGASKMRLDDRGDLVLSIGGGEIRQHQPVVYQELNGVRKEVSGQYLLVGKNRIGFKLAEYDRSQPLVIDPVLSYSTYLGTSGAEVARGLAVDALGYAYVTGQTSSLTFPTTAGSFQTVSGGSQDVFVTKLNRTGSALVFSTYLGGSAVDVGQGIAVTGSGVYVTGRTASTNFPATAGAFQTVSGGSQDVFIAKLNTAGSALVYSTYLGGTDVDTAMAIAVDLSGNAYVTGSTQSTAFPTAGAFQTAYGGGTDGFVTKVNAAGSALAYSSYLGGSMLDVAQGIAVDLFGNAYVTGRSASTNFPTTTGAFQTVSGGNQDAFVTKVNAAGAALAYSSYLGGSNADSGQGIVVSLFGKAYVTGTTFSTNFPTTAGAFQTALGGFSDAFVTKLDGAGSALVYSTYLGGTGADSGLAISVNQSGQAYVTGSTTSTDFPITADARQPANAGAQDAFVSRLNLGCSALVYSTYLGGADIDSGLAVVSDIFGNVYVAGSASSVNFPTTTGAFQTANAGGSEAFVLKFRRLIIRAKTPTDTTSGDESGEAGTSGDVEEEATDN